MKTIMIMLMMVFSILGCEYTPVEPIVESAPLMKEAEVNSIEWKEATIVRNATRVILVWNMTGHFNSYTVQRLMKSGWQDISIKNFFNNYTNRIFFYQDKNLPPYMKITYRIKGVLSDRITEVYSDERTVYMYVVQ